MGGSVHEIRDPIHVFVRMSSDERIVLDSRPFQRLRHIHQLAMTYQVYPGATHRRFEHSLGVMELAGRAFDVVTARDMHPRAADEFKDYLGDDYKRQYWKRALRMAALCHDIGHLPFSHAAEKELLPDGWTHERLTVELVRSEEMKDIWSKLKLDADDIVKLALGPEEAEKLKLDGLVFNMWETILSEIVVGNAFGVDRMDYLLRDSHHLGVAYGKFDHYRLLDSLRILPSPPAEAGGEEGEQLALGVDEGGVQSAEALMLARYMMYSQVYFHAVRRIYDIHLMDFLKAWLPTGKFSTDIDSHLALTDTEVLAAMRVAEQAGNKKESLHASRILQHKHFKVVYSRNPSDAQINTEAGTAVLSALGKEFGQEMFRHDRYRGKSTGSNFPVRLRDGRTASSIAVSEVLNKIPTVSTDYVFAERSVIDETKKWLKDQLAEVIKPQKEPEENHG